MYESESLFSNLQETHFIQWVRRKCWISTQSFNGPSTELRRWLNPQPKQVYAKISSLIQKTWTADMEDSITLINPKTLVPYTFHLPLYGKIIKKSFPNKVTGVLFISYSQLLFRLVNRVNSHFKKKSWSSIHQWNITLIHYVHGTKLIV